MIVSGGSGLAISLLSIFVVPKFRQIFFDFNVDLPEVTQVLLRVGDIIGSHWGWVALLPLSILWPLAIVPFMPVPQQSESRLEIVKITRLMVILVLLVTVIVIVFGIFAPMIELIRSVSGPQKS